ncbi:MAG: MmgE/PrpD family protein, partial [Pseudomonadota bacterium]
MSGTRQNDETVAERFAGFLAALTPGDLPADALDMATRDLIDAAGLCLAARPSIYMRQLLDSTDGDGPCTAIGHGHALGMQDAALANGVAIHGEDFDDTLEGAPIRVG